MSQPTRARTTGAARKPRNTSNTSPDATPPTPNAVASPSSSLPSVGTSAGRPRDVAEAAHDTVGAQPAAPVAAQDSLLAPDTLARTLRAVAAELERDPALARRVAAAVAAESGNAGNEDSANATSVGASAGRPLADDLASPPTSSRLNRTFRPKLVTGASPDLGSGIPDPFALYRTLGADGLRAALDELRLGSLRAIVREHGLDPKGTLSRQNDAGKLRAAILSAATKTRT